MNELLVDGPGIAGRWQKGGKVLLLFFVGFDVSNPSKSDALIGNP